MTLADFTPPKDNVLSTSFEPGVPALRPTLPAREEGDDPTLRLLRNCVEAMALLQGRIEDLETRAVTDRDEGARGLLELRADLTALQTGTSRAAATEARLAALELGTQEALQQQADELANARSEAATWRMRAETDAMAFEQLSRRLGTLETGLAAEAVETREALGEARQTILERDAEAADLKAAAHVSQDTADRLRSRLTSMDATIADQRARIACLQNKLATATYAIRFEQMSRGMETTGLPSPTGYDILDLGPAAASKALVSAA